jgi:DNA-binding NarL/FixJ family response regulator
MVTLGERRSAIILDSQPLWRDAFEGVMRDIGVDVVAKTMNVDEAMACLEEHEPDLFVLDFEIRGSVGGADSVREALNRRPDVKVLVIVPNEHASAVDDVLAAGASGALNRTADRDDIAAAVRQIFEPAFFLARRGPQRGSRARSNERWPGLTRREEEILSLVARGHSNRQVAKMLWVTQQTVKFHLSNIYRKLGVSNRTEASHWASLNGVESAKHQEPPLMHVVRSE